MDKNASVEQFNIHTKYFKDLKSARGYYFGYHYEPDLPMIVKEKITKGEIHIGTPPSIPGIRWQLFHDGRYGAFPVEDKQKRNRKRVLEIIEEGFDAVRNGIKAEIS